jgi:hypothetical protein
MKHGGEPDLLGSDPLDVSLGRVRAARPAQTWWRWRRLALGLSPTPAPGLLLPVGVMLGPEGLRLLHPTLLSYLDPAISVALAALGVIIGLGLDLGRPREGRLLAAASVEAGVTMVLVGLAVIGASRYFGGGAGAPAFALALLAGTCAAASATFATEADGPRALATRVGDLDDVLPIVVGGVALAYLHETSPLAATWLTLNALGLALAVALGGWLLIGESSSDAEQRVFTVGTVVLLGGIAEFLSLSALLAGLVAGAFWSALGGKARELLARDVRHMQHPLIVLLLLVAGARVGLPAGMPVLIGTYLVMRTAGKLLGGWISARLVAPELPGHLGLYFLSPGVIAVAFALNAVQAAGDQAGPILPVVVAGSIGAELLALFVRPAEDA